MIREFKPFRFCWMDLATVDVAKTGAFYEGTFGWQTRRQEANGGEFIRLTHEGQDVASVYQLSKGQIAGGVPSHWTPYVAVADIHEATSKTAAMGGQIVVNPFRVDGMARVSLVTDAGGALLGLWEILDDQA